MKQLITRVFVPGEITVIGLTGQAGAGKSNFTAPKIVKAAQEMGISCAILGLDAFFILSSKGRKKWIEEGWLISEEEGKRREDQIHWWDFQRTQNALFTLKSKQPLLLENIYNRADGGELTGTLEITPDPKGMIILLDGVAVAHLPVDHLWYVHAPQETRFNRLFARDNQRRQKQEEAKKRWALTQRFEQGYFPEYWERVDVFFENSMENGRLKLIDRPHPTDCL